MEGGHRTRILVVSDISSLVGQVCPNVFGSLKNHGVDDEVDAMFDMGRETLALPLEEKMKYEQGDQGFSFG